MRRGFVPMAAGGAPPPMEDAMPAAAAPMPDMAPMPVAKRVAAPDVQDTPETSTSPTNMTTT